jgi:hypothetical protein
MRNFAELNTAFNMATPTALRMGELVVHPSYQMREKINHDVIENYVDALDALPPVNVIEAEGRKILVDGFHRYFAFERAKREELPVLLIEGTEQDAKIYAMAANFKHLKAGSKPNNGEQKRAILKLLPLAVVMAGYNSSKITSSLKALGITTSHTTLNKWTAEAREEVDMKALRLAKELRTEMSARALAKKMNISRKLLTRLFSIEDKWFQLQHGKNDHLQSVITSTPIEEGDIKLDDAFTFEDDELEEMTVVNPADAKAKTLNALVEALPKDKAAFVSLVKPENKIKTTEQLQEQDSPPLIQALQKLAFSWKHVGKEDIKSFLNSGTEESEKAVKAILEAAEFIRNIQRR